MDYQATYKGYPNNFPAVSLPESEVLTLDNPELSTVSYSFIPEYEYNESNDKVVKKASLRFSLSAGTNANGGNFSRNISTGTYQFTSSDGKTFNLVSSEQNRGRGGYNYSNQADRTQCNPNVPLESTSLVTPVVNAQPLTSAGNGKISSGQFTLDEESQTIQATLTFSYYVNIQAYVPYDCVGGTGHGAASVSSTVSFKANLFYDQETLSVLVDPDLIGRGQPNTSSLIFVQNNNYKRNWKLNIAPKTPAPGCVVPKFELTNEMGTSSYRSLWPPTQSFGLPFWQPYEVYKLPSGPYTVTLQNTDGSPGLVGTKSDEITVKNRVHTEVYNHVRYFEEDGLIHINAPECPSWKVTLAEYPSCEIASGTKISENIYWDGRCFGQLVPPGTYTAVLTSGQEVSTDKINVIDPCLEDDTSDPDPSSDPSGDPSSYPSYDPSDDPSAEPSGDSGGGNSHCDCPDGYERVNGVCQPICEAKFATKNDGTQYCALPKRKPKKIKKIGQKSCSLGGQMSLKTVWDIDTRNRDITLFFSGNQFYKPDFSKFQAAYITNVIENPISVFDDGGSWSAEDIKNDLKGYALKKEEQLSKDQESEFLLTSKIDEAVKKYKLNLPTYKFLRHKIGGTYSVAVDSSRITDQVSNGKVTLKIYPHLEHKENKSVTKKPLTIELGIKNKSWSYYKCL